MMWKTFVSITLILAAGFAAALRPARAEIISEARMMGLPQRFYDEYLRPLRGKKEIITPLHESFHRGSYREIGRSQAEFFKKAMPHYVRDLNRSVDLLIPGDSPVRRIDAGLIRKKTAEFFPEFLEEIGGFAEAMGIDSSSALRLYTLYGAGSFFRPGCSIFAVGRERSADGRITVGRNYEWSPSLCDMAVTGVAPGGGYASLGCAYQTLGRIDGINEHGLFIGMTGSIARRSSPDGFLFPIIVRAVLDKAKNVDEAVNLLKRIPHADGFNYLVADRSGSAARVEPLPGGEVNVAYLSGEKSGVLAVTNHFQNPGSRGKNLSVMPNSLERLRIIARLTTEKERLSGDDVYRILTTERPGGLYWKGHETLFGTVFSGVYDLEGGSWRMKAGDVGKRYATAEFLRGAYASGTTQTRYRNEELFPLDFVAASPFGLVDLGSVYATGRLVFLSGPVSALAAEFNLAWKTGLFGNERTYGPYLEAGAYAFASPAFAKAGARFVFAPAPFFSLEVIPFYFSGWKVFGMEESSRENAEAVNRLLGDGESESHNTPGIHINPVLGFGGFINLENRFSRYDFDEPVYEYESCLIVGSGWVYSPRLTIIIPYSPRFLWGAMAAVNYEFAEGTYNAYTGPCVVFPKLLGSWTLFVNLSYWIKLSEGNDKVLLLAGLMGRIW
jgi:hypothetical protein